MRMTPNPEPPDFDRYTESYDSCLNQALATTGDDKEYFATGRVRWFARCLLELGQRPTSVLDFGCGTGSTAPLLLTELGCRTVIGVDTGAKTIEQARSAQANTQIDFCCVEVFHPSGQVDCAYCNGVFHHIPVAKRLDALALVHQALRPGGLFGFWENNPWNPGTQYVMSRCAFDGDAIKISPIAARRMLRQAGFEILRTDFLFFFPKAMSLLRPLEPALRKLPFGGQYQVLCRKP